MRSRDTQPELALRRELHRRGLRYRVNEAPLREQPRRTADVVFRRARVAVFVDGCFWHVCPVHSSQSKSNTAWWGTKLAANQNRDREADAALEAAGWLSLRIWEHTPLEEAVAAVYQALRRDTPESASGQGWATLG